MKKTPTLDRLGYKSFYRRNLPHIQPVDTDLFVTFRLAGSLPQHVLKRMVEERLWRQEIMARTKSDYQVSQSESARRHFAILEKYLDHASIGPIWLSNRSVADLVASAIHYRDGTMYRLDAFSIMPNHVHAVFRPSMRNNMPCSLSSIMHSLKRNTAKEANLVLHRSGAFWAHENFDHYIRDGFEWKRIVTYVLNNPVKAGLVDRWQNWPWNFIRDCKLIACNA